MTLATLEEARRYCEAISSLPQMVVIHPSLWQRVQAIEVYHSVFATMVKHAWKAFKAQFGPDMSKRTVQRLYVRDTKAKAWQQAQDEVIAREIA